MTFFSHKNKKNKAIVLFLLWLLMNLSCDAIFYGSSSLYRVALVNLIFSSILFGIGMMDVKLKLSIWLGLFFYIILFLYFLSMNIFTSLSVPYYGFLYLVLLGLSTVVEEKYQPEGKKKFWLHFARHALNIAGVVILSLYFSHLF